MVNKTFLYLGTYLKYEFNKLASEGKNQDGIHRLQDKLIQEMNNRLTNASNLNNAHYWLSNYGNIGQINFNKNEVMETEINDQLRERVMNQFKEIFSDEMKLLRNTYGMKNVNVRFGILKFWC
jgi:hypothetical protein